MRAGDYLALAFRSLRRSRLRSGLTISAIVVGATGLTIMLTFVTSVKSYVVNQFVSTGQNRQILVAQNSNLFYNASGDSGPGPAPVAAPAPAAGSPDGGSSQGSGAGQGGAASTTVTLAADLEAKIAAIPHVTGVAAVFDRGFGQIAYLAYGAKQLQANNLQGYEPDGVINPTLVAGRDLRASDASGVVLLTQDYADALGFTNAYAKLVGQTLVLHTTNGYTGVGATLPNVLPPQNDCGRQGQGPGQRPSPGCFSGPLSGLPSVDIPAQIVGVVASSFNHQTVYLPLSWMIGLQDQAQPKDIQYASQFRINGGNAPRPGQPGQPNQQGQPSQPNQQGQPGQPNQQGQPGQPNQGGGFGQPGPGPQGPGTVVGGWTRPDPAQVIADAGGYNSFLVTVDKTNQVATVAATIDRLGVNTATGLHELNNQKSKANVVGAILGGLGLIALFIAALGVMNTMVMSVLERTREIGVMRALGARRSTIRRLFTFEAASLGFFGGLFGVLIGYAFVLAAKPVISHSVTSGKLAGANFSVSLWLVVLVVGLTTAIGLASGLLPARRAARLDPVEALRYE